MDQHRFIVVGTGAPFTCRVLETLIERSYPPLAYIQFAPRAVQQGPFARIEVEIGPPPRLAAILETNAVPFYFQPRDDMAGLIRQLDADYLLVACWPGLLSENILKSVTIAALNLHPSLLPKFRGPDPIQAQLQSSDHDFGVTLHLMNEHYDAGDIVLQEKIAAGNRPEKSAIETMAAVQGAQLFMHALETHKIPGWSLIKQ